MSDKEPRKRRKKKELHKKEDLSAEESVPTPREKSQEHTSKESERDVNELLVCNEPNGFAKCVFFILFSILVVAVAAVFLALHGADRGALDFMSESEHVENEEPLFHAEIHPEWEEAEEDEGWTPITETKEHEEIIEDIVEGLHEKIETPSRAEEAKLTDEETVQYISDIEDFDKEIDKRNGEENRNLADDVSVEMELKDINTETQTEEIPKDIQFVDVLEKTLNQNLPYSSEELPSPQPGASIPEEIAQSPSRDEEISSLSTNDKQSSSPHDKDDILIQEEVSEEQIIFHKSADQADQPTPPVQSDAVPETLPDVSQKTSDDDKTSEWDAQHSIREEEHTGVPASPMYEKEDITNSIDFEIKDELDEADNNLEKSPEKALKHFEELLKQHPQSPRAEYGKAQSLDRMAEQQRSNSLLEQAVAAYQDVLSMPKVPDKLYLLAANRAVDRMRFRGLLGKALNLQKHLADKYPENVNIHNQLAVTYLLVGKGQEAKKVLKKIIKKHPDIGYAKVHYGFILKTEDNNYDDGIKYLREGIATREPGVIDGRFFFHLGDALARTGKKDEAMEVYEQGVKEGVFLSAYQRSLYNVKGLKGQPWWMPEETTYYNYILLLEKNWKIIKNEALAILNEQQSGFRPESEGLRDTGDWKQFEMFARGQKFAKNCDRVPRTCALIENIPDAVGCKRGQVKFSVMQPGTHVWAHTGPTNCRLRAHLGLVIPKGVRIRVANETREWTEGKTIVFDDSFEHEVWHNGNQSRLVLIVDFWHPELTAHQKRTLTPI
ncbi:aspartyl/asparaginyl beta-hydroxylase-like [Limulus polyphemus]|uniref:Aspartyl/asparaginyl beta-hydroxylase-like n=1 Tax=Limulus polyphemus TaxID=6850 RepID=A0ABM1BF86_LIMPO|nr:aspartyl/asparaginyl beta-hydroxylase-like [Limulus polyphemus]